MKYQKVQSDHKMRTRETRGLAKTERQQVQPESANEAPESTIRDHKMSTRETRGLAKTEHQQVQSESSNSKWDNDAHVCRNATTGDDFCFLVGDSKACGTTCNEPEVRGSKAYGDFNGRPAQGGAHVFSGG